MVENFDIKAPIVDELKRGLVLGLQARLPIGSILSFAGYHHQIMPLMQTLSHSTRAYIINADGLRGFVLVFDIMNFLKVEDEASQLEHAR